MPAMVKKAAVYTRISADYSGEAKGVERQSQDCHAHATKQGYTVVATYEDNDVSAAGRAKQRPQYEAMMDAAASGAFDVIVAYSNSRLTRRPLELEDLINLHLSHGTVVDTVVSGQDNLGTADGRMVARIKANVDAAEAERVAERLTRQKEQRAAEGKPQGGRYRVMGYDRSFNVVDEEAAIVREVFKRRAAGESTKAIATDLAKRGVKGTSGHVVKSSTIDHMLRNAGYAGKRAYKGVIVGDTSYPALIDYATFLVVADNMQKVSVGTNARKHLLSGILICSACLSGMTGKNGGKKRNPHYKCAEAYGGCGNVSIQMAGVDEAVFNAAWRKQQDTSLEATESARDWTAEINGVDALIKKTQAAYSDGSMDPEDALPILQDLRTKKKGLERERAESATEDLGVFSTWLDYEAMNLSQKRLFIGRYIKNVIVSPWDKANPKEYMTRLEVFYQDGTKERLSTGVIVDTSEAVQAP